MFINISIVFFRCGIVLCQRDAKFAVECDTCKMSYCLVCLASGTKEPCVRCGQRPSKRVEQLVHLRLKSIYKAFKQSGAALDNNNSKTGAPSRKKPLDAPGHTSGKQSICKNDSSTEKGVSVCVEIGNAPNIGNTKFQRGEDKKKGSKMQNGPPLNGGDVGAVLQVAAAAAASAAASTKESGCKESSQKKWGDDMEVNPEKIMPQLNRDGSISFRSRKEPKKNASDLYASKTEAEADAAAASLLAELEKEKEQNKANNKAKKSKKKKKKERQAAKEREKEEKARLEEEEKATAKLASIEAQKQKQVKKNTKKASKAEPGEEEGGKKSNQNQNSNEKKSKKKKGKTSKPKPPSPLPDEQNDESDDDDIMRLAAAAGIDITAKSSKTVQKKDDTNDEQVETRLAAMISANDLDGIESVLTELKGVPGRAALRKNAKKALKKIREEIAATEVSKSQNDEKSATVQSTASTDIISGQAHGYKATEPLLKLVSNTHRVQSSSGGTPRSECVMHMAPSVVGWVIGKGGQRIRDLMEDSGAKVWIDQDSMGAHDMRIVYVSGTKKAIDTAVRTIKDLVAKAPVGGTTQPIATVPSVVNDTASVTSARSDLTSTPVSMIQNFTTQAPAAARKPDFSPPKRYVEPIAEMQPSAASPLSKKSPHSSPSHSMPLPPPGLEAMSNSPTVSSLTVSHQSNDDVRTETPKSVRELFCEPRFVPLLIGRRGWTVKNIQDTSGARVDIDQKVIPRRIIISGDEDQVNKAVRLVSEVLSYPHAQSNYNTSESVGGGDMNAVLHFQNRRSNLNGAEVHDGHISAASLPGSAPDVAHFPVSLQNETGQEPMRPLRESSLPPLSQYTNAPLDFGTMPNDRSLNEPPMRQPLEHTNGFGYGQQIRHQTLPVQMNSPRQTMPPTASNSVHASPAAYLARQSSAPLPFRPSGSQMSPEPFDRNFLRGNFNEDRQSLSGNFQFDTILPLNNGGAVPPHNFTNVAQEPNIGSNLFSRQPMQPKNDHDVVSDLFGQPVHSPHYPLVTSESQGERADPLLQGFGGLSLGGGGGDNGLGLEGANWDWEGLMNDEGSSNHRVGLGGVRLDTTSEMQAKRNTENQFQSNWGA